VIGPVIAGSSTSTLATALIDFFADLPVVPLGIGAAGRDRLLELSPQHIAAPDSRRDRLVILGANRVDETIKLGPLMNDAHKMRHLGDHAARLGCVLKIGDTADPVEAESDERLALLVMPPYRTAGLLDCYACPTHIVALRKVAAALIVRILRGAFGGLFDLPVRQREEAVCSWTS
jgi:hypothetical protein